jgi:hypothetical protein
VFEYNNRHYFILRIGEEETIYSFDPKDKVF